MAGVPIADGLFTWPSDEPRLIGGSCGRCGALSFPRRAGCPRCGASGPVEHLIGARGTLWTWTSQGFAPKEPFNGAIGEGGLGVPWYVGLVEIPGEIRVEALLTGVSEEDLRIGMPLRLVVVPWRTDDEGREVVTFAFAPDPDGQRSSETEEVGARA
ncbi:Zn-ribbon domain-containing OB-fold protein [Trujillonella endophytica]|uniref:Uncharacterized OB-fold protein, contains Zn-ribbon domain n=1 Tax=Trujillonella endophytica TaxID=673521 RepID=A0A1H8Q5Q0_9ACTN|nr:OB-fold domain-containing protein [Trujillella endophytica]SEO49549.1 Uncharacterized OB-fold protein, contains Zn-ribbon domain [Trujillella endophytica]